MGYDRSRHVSKTDYDLWIPDSWFRVHPKPGPPGDDLAIALGNIASDAEEIDAPGLPEESQEGSDMLVHGNTRPEGVGAFLADEASDALRIAGVYGVDDGPDPLARDASGQDRAVAVALFAGLLSPTGLCETEGDYENGQDFGFHSGLLMPERLKRDQA